jgi:hypothetical protein
LNNKSTSKQWRKCPQTILYKDNVCETYPSANRSQYTQTLCKQSELIQELVWPRPKWK